MSFNAFTNLYKRSERLSSAVFLVSNIITSSTELRTKIQNLSLDLISTSAYVKDSNPTECLMLLSKIESILLQSMSLLDIAKLSGFISDMNADILKSEFDSFLAELGELRSYVDKSGKITKEYFNTASFSPQVNMSPAVLNSNYSNEMGLSISSRVEIDDYKRSQNEERDKSKRQETREKAILDLIKNRGSVNIKDISKSIKGCSEKTIQRKLVSLINSGIIKKRGERRWSVYSLA